MVKTAESVIARGKLLWVPLDRLRANPWNPNRMDDFMFNKEMESIKKFGVAQPIVVRDHEDDLFEIIDGEHRLRALDHLGWEQAPVWNMGQVPDTLAKQLTVVLNEIKGSPEKSKMSDLLKDLLSSETTESLLTVLPFSKEKFDELVDVPSFDWDSFDSEPRHRSEDSWVERIYRLPTDAAAVLDRAIAAAKEDETTPDGIALERIAADFLAG